MVPLWHGAEYFSWHSGRECEEQAGEEVRLWCAIISYAGPLAEDVDEVKGATEGVYHWWSLLESSVQSYLRGGESNLVGQGNLIRFQSKHSSAGSRGLSQNVAANCICLRFPQTHRTTPMKARSRWNRNHNSLTTESTSSFTSILIP